MAAIFGHCWWPAGEQKKQHRHGSSQRSTICVSLWGCAQCLLPVVLMPPTVGELQAQLVGYLLGLYTATLSFPSIIFSLPPADNAKSPSVAVIHSFPRAQTHTKVSKHAYVYMYSDSAQHSAYLLSMLKHYSTAVLFMGHATFYPICPWYLEQWCTM